jgi:hypothetical protein
MNKKNKEENIGNFLQVLSELYLKCEFVLQKHVLDFQLSRKVGDPGPNTSDIN